MAGSVALAAWSSGVPAATARLSLNPYEAGVQDGGLQASGDAGPIVLPDTSPYLLFSLVVPANYGGKPLRLVLLWESPDAVDCNFVLRPNAVFRGRNGRETDYGSASDGILPLEASTPFTTDGGFLTMQAPDPAGSVESATFQLVNAEFPGAFRPGDAVDFSLYRYGDTCSVPLIIDGASVEYEVATPP